MNNKIKKILCPIDFSTASINAMEYAAKLSKEMDTSLTLWNICEIPIIDQIDSNLHLPNEIEKKQNELSQILQDWCEEIKEEYDIPCGYFSVSSVNDLNKKIERYTDGENFDLIIAGTNGINNIYQFFFDTNSHNILTEVKCPIIIIPEGYPSKKIESVVFVTDFFMNDLELIKGLIQTFNANITFIYSDKKENQLSNEAFETFQNLIKSKLGKSTSVHFERLVYQNKANGPVKKIIEKKADIIIIADKDKS